MARVSIEGTPRTPAPGAGPCSHHGLPRSSVVFGYVLKPRRGCYRNELRSHLCQNPAIP